MAEEGVCERCGKVVICLGSGCMKPAMYGFVCEECLKERAAAIAQAIISAHVASANAMVGKYRCARCGGIFDKIRSDEETLAELHEQFGEDVCLAECDIVCDGCWQEIRPDRNKKILERWRTHREKMQ